MKRHLIGVAAVAMGTLLMGGVVVQTASAAPPVPTIVTLPLFGAPLELTITTGPGGALTDVSVDPADNTVADKLSPRKVVFESANPTDPTSTAKVVVKSKKGGQSVSARAGSLADISGPGSWSGDLFGTGSATTVNFIIGATVDGGPDITGVTSSDATAVIGAVKYSSDDDDDDDEQSARVSIKFTDPVSDQSRTLTIKVKVEDDDDETEAKLSISLSRLKGVAVPAAEAVGAHTWSGVLCDGTAATITYEVAIDGSVSAVVASPAADVRTDDSKIDARFETGERIRIRVREDDGMIKISVEERIRCDAEDPTTNAETTSTVDDDDDDDENEDNDDNRGRDDDDDDDDASSTSEVTTTNA